MVIILVGILALWGAPDGRAMQASQILPAPRLSPKIPPADRRRYMAVRSSEEWKNPYLMATATGFELKSASSPQPRVVLVKNLQQELADLPISDWPYGRVAVVQSPSIVPADAPCVKAMDRNIEEARKILKALGAEEWGWPA